MPAVEGRSRHRLEFFYPFYVRIRTNSILLFDFCTDPCRQYSSLRTLYTSVRTVFLSGLCTHLCGQYSPIRASPICALYGSVRTVFSYPCSVRNRRNSALPSSLSTDLSLRILTDFVHLSALHTYSSVCSRKLRLYGSVLIAFFYPYPRETGQFTIFMV